MHTATAVGLAIGAGIVTAVLLALLCGGCTQTIAIHTRTPDGIPNSFVIPEGSVIRTPFGDRYEVCGEGILTAAERSGSR